MRIFSLALLLAIPLLCHTQQALGEAGQGATPEDGVKSFPREGKHLTFEESNRQCALKCRHRVGCHCPDVQVIAGKKMENGETCFYRRHRKKITSLSKMSIDAEDFRNALLLNYIYHRNLPSSSAWNLVIDEQFNKQCLSPSYVYQQTQNATKISDGFTLRELCGEKFANGLVDLFTSYRRYKHGEWMHTMYRLADQLINGGQIATQNTRYGVPVISQYRPDTMTVEMERGIFGRFVSKTVAFDIGKILSWVEPRENALPCPRPISSSLEKILKHNRKLTQ